MIKYLELALSQEVYEYLEEPVWPDLVILITFGNISRFFWLFW
jgi:hypothetical protein